MNILCENIRRFRKEQGLTQKELAEQLNISDKTVSRWESGVQLPEASLIPDIARILHHSIDELYGIERQEAETSTPPAPKKNTEKILLDFKIWMIAGTLVSLLGSLLYRYFGSTVFVSSNIIDAEYYNTAKGATADIFAFVGIIAIFAGLAAIIITKVRFAMLNKPQMDDPAFAVNARYTGAAVVVFSVIFLKTAPEVLSFGYFLPHSVYGAIFIFALSAILLWYKRQMKKRRIAVTKKFTVISLISGAVGAVLGIAAYLLRDYAYMAPVDDLPAWLLQLSGAQAPGSTAGALQSMVDANSLTYSGVNMLSMIATVMLTVGDILLLLMPVILYVELLIRLRKH